ncbi:MAG: DmsC/YnfH family molybdoenzyme membrane anchor subunit [Pseudomonadota bacterium]
MYPALSVIFFTTLSGIGYGLVMVVALAALAGRLPGAQTAVAALVVASVLITAGLLSSLAHLGHPERAWRALSQWRSSWLSREGVLAIISFAPLIALIGTLLRFEPSAMPVLVAAAAAALSAAATVYSTAMIYASLKPVRQWHSGYVPTVYLAFALMTGAVWACAVMSVTPEAAVPLAAFAVVLTLVAWAIKAMYWRAMASDKTGSTLGSATGLGASVTVLDPPHTERNYLLREMGFKVARKHRGRLRRIALACGLVAPVLLLGIQLLALGRLAVWLAVPAALLLTLGVVVERWLFFAEAEHTVTLYYDR